MNQNIIALKDMRRAMQPFVLTIYEMVLEGKMNNVLEIGVRQAQSTRAILSALHENGTGSLVSIDLGDRSERIPEEYKALWETIVGDSHSAEIHNKVPVIAYDMLLIDGDHTYEGVKRDYEMYNHFVKPGGYIIFHDVINKDCGVPQFWKELQEEQNGFQMIELPWGVAGLGILQTA